MMVVVTLPLALRRSGKSPSGRVGHTITALGARLLVLGGREYATNYFDCHLHSFDVRTRHWSQVPLHTSSPRGEAARSKWPGSVDHGRRVVACSSPC